MNTIIARVLITLAILLSGTAIVPLVSLPENTFEWQRYTDTYECSENCLVVTSINLDAAQQGKKFGVVAMITVADENGNPLRQATISVKWKLPNGAQYTQRAETDMNGVAIVQTMSRSGEYTVKIINGKKLGYQFDPDSSVLTNTIITP
jgi:hypothetical protein